MCRPHIAIFEHRARVDDTAEVSTFVEKRLPEGTFQHKATIIWVICAALFRGVYA